MISKHGAADLKSQGLCDRLFGAYCLAQPAVQRNEAKTCCSVGTRRDARAFYVYHQQETIAVWPRWPFSDADTLKSTALILGLEVGVQKTVGNTWNRHYPLSVLARTDKDVVRVIKLLLSEVDAHGDELDTLAGESREIAHEIAPPAQYPEGGKKTITVNAYERNAAARLVCIAIFGARCVACGFEFKEKYGPIGDGFIHVHHLIPISSIGKSYEVDPRTDLCPVCPNCHQMIHRRTPPLTIEELRRSIR